MAYSVRQMSKESKLLQQVELKVFEQVVPRCVVHEVLSALDAWEERERKLNMEVIFWLVMAMNLYPTLSQPAVLHRLSQGARYLWADDEEVVASKGAISQRREQLGVKPVVELFHRCCRPMAQAGTRGSQGFGMRLVAMDSTLENAPDTPANARAFGFLSNPQGHGPFPQVRGVYLMECGTHAIIDAGFWPCRVGDTTAAKRLLRSVEPGMLLLWDSNFHSAPLVAKAHWQRGAHVLGKLASNELKEVDARLADGTALCTLYPDDSTHRKGRPLQVRVIEYTLALPGVEGAGERHRLLTTLLDPERYPAEALIELYHERWEIEVAIDEIDTHQRLLQRTLRSQTPAGVIQELYGTIIGYYALRFVMHEAALLADVDPDRLSFVGTINVVQMAVPEFQMTVAEQLPRLCRRLLRDVGRQVLSTRQLRLNPRCVKRKGSKFPVKRAHTPPGVILAKPFRDVILLI